MTGISRQVLKSVIKTDELIIMVQAWRNPRVFFDIGDQLRDRWPEILIENKKSERVITPYVKLKGVPVYSEGITVLKYEKFEIEK